jgi:RimJ/RimL family protein N-acetyltransferase
MGSTSGGEALITSTRLSIRDLVPDDLALIQRWHRLDDPSSRLWNIPRRVSAHPEPWHGNAPGKPTRLWYAVVRIADSRLVGSITLREIDWRASARLGVSFGAQYVNKGYGTEALGAFLQYFYVQLGFQSLILDVAATNTRARHVYRKLGFQHQGQHFRTIPRDVALEFLRDSRFRAQRLYFRRHFARTQLLFFDMVLDRESWRRVSGGQTPPRATTRGA